MPLDTSNNHDSEAPSRWLLEHAAQLPRPGRILDLACGSGRHARWLVSRGFEVLAVDRDPHALAGLDGVAGVTTAQHDLERGGWPLGDENFAGIVVCRYLHRPLLPSIAGALAPGGVLIYETFMAGNAAYGRPSRPDFLLQPGELLSFAQAQGLAVLDFVEGFVAEPKPAMMQAICARRNAGGSAI
jgi:SAM-dependent methyltransferase